MSDARYPIRISAVFGLVLRLLKVKKDTAWVELGDDGLHIEYGYVAADVAYDNIEEVAVRHWPTLYGFGLRVGPKRTMGYVAAGGNVVWLVLKEPQPLSLGVRKLTLERKQIAVSVADPEAFTEALRLRL